MFKEFCSTETALKICGITLESDGQGLADLGVDAVGINFWPSSKRYCSPEQAAKILPPLKGRILRVGVFVNNAIPLADELVEKGLIDVVQLHGDETLDDVRHFIDQGIPVIRAVSASKLPQSDLPHDHFALLIDTPAGKNYGGTGETFDWSLARNFIVSHLNIPVILAGGITADNAAAAVAAVHPVALDIASGAEISPGVKDFEKVTRLLAALS